MKKTFTKLLFTAAITILAACTKSTQTPAPPADTTNITVTVKDVDSWSSANSSLTAVSGATVYLYDSQAAVTANTPVYTKTTGTDGTISIPVTYKSQYYIVVAKDGASNIDGGYLVSGVFQSDADIAQSAIQTNSAPGWPKFADVNGDGKIDSKDAITADIINPKQNQTTTYTAYIVKPVVSGQIKLSAPSYPVLSPDVAQAGLCLGSITATFTCPAKFWDAGTNTLHFVDDSKTLRTVNGVMIGVGIGYLNAWNLSGDLNVGTGTYGPVLTYSNVTITNGTVTGIVSALIEPGNCSTSPNYKTTYVQNLAVQLCYSTLLNGFQVKGGTIYVASNLVSVAQPGS